MTVVPFGLLGIGFGFFSLNYHNVIPKNSGDDRDHVGFYDASSDIFRATHTNVDNALESQIPFPHVHFIFASAFFEDAHEAFDAAIDGKDVSDACRRGRQVGEVVEGVYKGKGGGTVEGSAVIEGSGDMNGGLVDVWNAEIDLSHRAPSRGMMEVEACKYEVMENFGWKSAV